MDRSILVICVDRDNDIGEKLGIKGPIFGRKENLEVAQKLAIADPEESDANSIFGAIKEYDHLKSQKKKVEIVTLTGDKKLGTVSDSKIAEQLEVAMVKRKANEAVFVSDGAEDEYVLPLVHSRLKILSVKKVIVKQSSQLETGYYVAIKFFKDLVHDPQTSRIYLGIPAVALVIYALLGDLAWRFIFGFVGLYLLVKAFHLEEFVMALTKELQATFSKGKLSFFCYILGLSLTIVGFYQGYESYLLYINSSLLVSILSFINGGLVYYLFAGISILTGRLLYISNKRGKLIKYLTYYALFFSIYIVLENSIKYIIVPDYNIAYLVIAIPLGFMIILVALMTEKIAYSK